MKIKQKTKIVAVVSITILALLTFLIFSFTYYGYINKDYEDDLEESYRAIDYILKNEKNNLQKMLIDWARWDDTYKFISDLNENYIDSNLSDNTLRTLGIQMMIFLNNDNEIVFLEEYNLDEHMEQDLLKKIFLEKQEKGTVESSDDLELLLVNDETFFVLNAPITKSDDISKVNGSLIFVRKLDEKLLSYVKEITKVNLEFKDYEKVNNKLNTSSKFLGEGIKINVNDNKNIQGFKVIKNKYGEENIALYVSIDKKDGSNAKTYLTLFILGFLMFLISIIKIDYIIIDRYFFSRLSKLTTFMKVVSDTKDTTLRLNMPGNDEFSKVAESTNEMLVAIDDAHKDIKSINKRFRTIMEATNDGYIDFNIQTKELYISKRWKEYIGYKGKDGYELFEDYISKIHPECMENVTSTFLDLINGKIDYTFNEYKVLTVLGEYVWVMQRGKVSEWDENRKPLRLVSSLSDITRRKKYEQEILHLSYSDKLTGLRNRAFMERQFNKLDLDDNSKYFIIMGDVNGLKFLNDNLGHREGDKLICKIGEILKRNISNNDIISRWGGDEFVILVKDKDSTYIGNLINKIKADCKLESEDHFKLSIALGYAEKGEENVNTEQVMNLAEKRMYRNKLLENDSARSSTISSLIKTLQEKHSETEEHTLRIKDLSLKLGKRLGLTQDKLDELELVAVLHDIGKVGIPEQILMKPGKLDASEWDIMKNHTKIGYRIVKSTPQLEHIADEILYHHEKYDGTGYPEGLRANDIPLVSRIINICDSYDVMTNRRSYKEALNEEYAINELTRCAGTQFDPWIVEEFLSLLKEESNK